MSDYSTAITLLDPYGHIGAHAVIPNAPDGQPFVTLALGDLVVYLPRQNAAATARKLARDLGHAADLIDLALHVDRITK